MKKFLFYSLALAFGLVSSQQAMALEQKDGVYLINNGQDLEEFSNMVASGNGGISAVLTADIDMDKIDHQPIGTVSSPFRGTFDGQQHYIMNMIIDLPEQEYVGLFGVLNDGAYIKNVIVDWSCFVSGSAFVGAIAGGTNGGGTVTFENCGNEGSVGAQNQNAAGICGVSMDSACGIRLINCFNTGGISGGRESAALCGWVGNSGSVIQNCYNAGFVIGMDGSNSLWRNGNGKGTNNYDSYGNQGTLISEDEYDLSSGTVAYQINGNQSNNVVWFQTLGEDLHPVPFSSHGVVYAVGDLYCDGSSKGGELTFSNTNESNRDPHKFVNGVCSNCGEVDKSYMSPVGDTYMIGTADELNWFAAMVNHGETKINAQLTGDIDFSQYTLENVMIGGDAYTLSEEAGANSFEGSFDGNDHKITINYVGSYDGMALFKVINNATIRNLVVEGTMESTERFMGGVAFVCRGTSTFENIIVNVNMTGSYSGDATDGGICAVAHEHATFRNCAFIGSMNAPSSEGSAAIIGYAHGENETIIENCYIAASLLDLTGNSTVIARHVRNILNCYYTDNILLMDESNSTAISEGAVATGELCYLIDLNGETDAWRQNLGSDKYPVPFLDHAMVYASGSLTCDGKMSGNISYSNSAGATTQDPHQYDANGVCTVCGGRLITSVAQFVALANDINTGVIDGDVIIDLDTDIDLSGQQFEGFGIRHNEPNGETDEEGNPIMVDVKRPYKGTFNGHGHVISNMIIDSQEGNKGLFSLVSGATIKNVTVDATCEIYSAGYSAGIVGCTTGRGTVTIENCGNEAMVNVGAEGVNGAGILGVNDLSEAFIRIINCYNAGDIIGQRECGTISGWLGDNFEVKNTYNCGTVNLEAVDGFRTFARYNGADGDARFVNCYEVDGSQVQPVSTSDVASGKLCYDLNQAIGSNVFYQTLGSDTHPVLIPTHGVVTYEGGQYSNGINEIVNSKSSNGQWYDLQGRKVASQPSTAVANSQFSVLNSQLKKGLYITNGKKVLVK